MTVEKTAFDAIVRTAHALRLLGCDVGGTRGSGVRPRLVLDTHEFIVLRDAVGRQLYSGASMPPGTSVSDCRIEVAGLLIVTRP